MLSFYIYFTNAEIIRKSSIWFDLYGSIHIYISHITTDISSFSWFSIDIIIFYTNYVIEQHISISKSNVLLSYLSCRHCMSFMGNLYSTCTVYDCNIPRYPIHFYTIRANLFEIILRQLDYHSIIPNYVYIYGVSFLRDFSNNI